MHAAELAAAELGPYCERLAIAGSLRRRLETCKDIEIVAVPKVRAETRPAAEVIAEHLNALPRGRKRAGDETTGQSADGQDGKSE